LARRTRGRKFLLQCRYAADANGASLEENMIAMSFLERVPDDETRKWTKALGNAVSRNRASIDEAIEPALDNWSLGRLTSLTRLILEQAVAEVFHMSIPAPVAVKEAVMLAQEFEGPGAGSFINGVLDKVLFEKRDAGPT
jgi:transcription antitermination protein NusB